MLNTTKTVRYTATLPSDYIDELKQLAKAQQIPSVNFAIRQALDEYLKQAKRREYDEMMKKAAKDKFPTLECCILSFGFLVCYLLFAMLSNA